MGIGWVVGLTLIGVLAWTRVQATPRRRDSGRRRNSVFPPSPANQA